MKNTLSYLAALLVLAGAGYLSWRVLRISGLVDFTRYSTEKPDEAGDGVESAVPTSLGRNVTLKYFDPETGRLILIVKAETSNTEQANARMTGVRLTRYMSKGQGVLLASSRTGIYDRRTGSGKLKGAVVVRRIPESEALREVPDGQKKADLVVRSESLSWNQSTETLTSDDYVEVTWNDSSSQRTVTAGGQGLVGERWGQTVTLKSDVTISIAEAGLPARLSLGAKHPAQRRKEDPAAQAPLLTIIKSSGPGLFRYDSNAGFHRVILNRDVIATRDKIKLTCDQLEMLLRSDGSDRNGAPSPDISAARAGSTLPDLPGTVNRWIMKTVEPRGRKVSTAKVDVQTSKGAGMVDLVIARGSVTVTSPEGVARGELGWYDHSAGVLWLEGSEEAMAEVLRKEGDQLLAERFWFDVISGDMGKAGKSRASVTIEK